MEKDSRPDAGKVVKSSIWYTICNFLIKGMGFITTPIFSSLLSKSEFGDYSNFQTWLSILLMIVTFNLYVSINRSRFDFPGKIDEFSSSILIFGTSISAVFYIIVCINMEFFKNLFSMDEKFIHAMFIYMLVQPAMEAFQSKQHVTYKYKASVILSLSSTIVSTGVSLLFVILFEDKLMGRIMGYIGPLIAINLAIYIYIIYKGKCFKWEYCKYAFLYAWPFIPHLLAMHILSASDKIMIKNICGAEDAAIYSIAVTCVSVATLLMNSLNTALSPWVFDKLMNKEEHELKKITVPYLLIFAVPVQMAILVAPEIIYILGSGKYAESVSVVVPLLSSVVVQFCYCLYVNVEQFARKTWAIATGTCIAAGVNVGLNFILIPKYGYTAAAYTTLVGYLVLFAVHFTFVRIIGYKKVWEDKAVFTLIAAQLVLVPFYFFIYKHTIARYAIFVILGIAILVVGYKKRKDIIALLKKKA